MASREAAGKPPPTRELVVDAAIAVLRENKGTATVAATAMGVYRADARFKDFVKNQLGTTMLDLLLQHPQYFELHHSRNVVALSTPPSVGSAQEVYMTDEVASHNHKPDECMVVNGDVVHAQPRAQLTLIKGVCVCVCVCVDINLRSEQRVEAKRRQVREVLSLALQIALQIVFCSHTPSLGARPLLLSSSLSLSPLSLFPRSLHPAFSFCPLSITRPPSRWHGGFVRDCDSEGE